MVCGAVYATVSSCAARLADGLDSAFAAAALGVSLCGAVSVYTLPRLAGQSPAVSQKKPQACCPGSATNQTTDAADRRLQGGVESAHPCGLAAHGHRSDVPRRGPETNHQKRTPLVDPTNLDNLRARKSTSPIQTTRETPRWSPRSSRMTHRGLTQFSTVQRQAYQWAVQRLHDFDLGRMPKLEFSDEVLGRLTDFHETKMNKPSRQRVVAPDADQKPEGSSGRFHRRPDRRRCSILSTRTPSCTSDNGGTIDSARQAA